MLEVRRAARSTAKQLAVLAACSLGVLAVGAPAAMADPQQGPKICPAEGTPVKGNFRNLTITGNAYVEAGTQLTVKGNLTLAPKACLDAFTTGTVSVGGSVRVLKAATLALGCSPGAIGEVPPCGTTTTHDVVHGSINATEARTLYLDGDLIEGSVNSEFGGQRPTANSYLTFPIKENVIKGSITIYGWKGSWFGMLRNKIYGNVTLFSILTTDPDSMEIASNTVLLHLMCWWNGPAPQFGDSEGEPNIVGVAKEGQCAKL